MADIVRLLQLDHHIARSQFGDLYRVRATAGPDELDTAWRPLASLLRSHLDGTRLLLADHHLDVDELRRRRLSASVELVTIAVDDVERERSGTQAWWAAVAELRRRFADALVTSDEWLVELLRAALDNGQRNELGQLWLDQHQHR